MHSVLIVENRKKWRRLFKEGLESKGYYVVAVRTAEHAEKVLKQNTSFDVAVLNLHLLTKSDFLIESVLECIQCYSPSTPCILVSGSYDRFIGRLGRYRARFVQNFAKMGPPSGFDLDQLFDAVARAIQNKLDDEPSDPKTEPQAEQDGQATADSDQALWTELRNILQTRFDESELRQLVFDLGINYGDLEGSNHPDRVMSLLNHVRRHTMLNKLIQVGKVQRGDIAWPTGT